MATTQTSSSQWGRVSQKVCCSIQGGQLKAITFSRGTGGTCQDSFKGHVHKRCSNNMSVLFAGLFDDPVPIPRIPYQTDEMTLADGHCAVSAAVASKCGFDLSTYPMQQVQHLPPLHVSIQPLHSLLRGSAPCFLPC